MINLRLKSVLNVGLYFVIVLFLAYTILNLLNVEKANKTKAEHFWGTLSQSFENIGDVKNIDIASWDLNKMVEPKLKETVKQKTLQDYLLLATFMDGEESRVLIKGSDFSKWFLIGSVMDGFVIESVSLYSTTLKDKNGNKHFLKMTSKSNKNENGMVGGKTEATFGTKKDNGLTKALIDLGKVKPPNSLPPLPPGMP